MPLNPFKNASQKADEEFRHAYEKGVNLGPQSWTEAVTQFSNAAKHYAEVGNSQRSKLSYALALLFQALSSRNPEAWEACSKAMADLGESSVYVGFTTNSADISKQADILGQDLAATSQLTSSSNNVSRVPTLKTVAERYLELTGSDLAIWKLQKQEIDPQKRAYYLLGLASLIEANSTMEQDPGKSVSLLSEAATYLELAGIDPMNLTGDALTRRDNASRVAKCWFCGRRAQGLNFHYVTIPSYISPYVRQNYGSESPQSILGQSVAACMGCYSSIRYVADMIARDYHQKAMAQIDAVNRNLSARIDSLEREIHSLRSRLVQFR
ncbi:MAG: hypothetical protein ABSG45_02345 [Nitrososphaerales archaeon]